MATLTDPGTSEDQRGKDLVDGAHQREVDRGTAGPDAGTGAGIDQAEANSNDPANASGGGTTPPPSGPGGGTTSGGSEDGGGRFSRALKATGSFASRNKKKLAFAGGGLVLGGLPLVVILFLLPLKLVSVMANITGKAAAASTNAVEHRTERIVLLYLAQKAGVSVGSGVVIENGPLATLYANWSKNGFEKKLAAKGIEIKPGDTPGRIVVVANGKADPPQSLEDFINKDLNSSDARAFFRNAVDETTHSSRWLRRLHLRGWLRNAVGVRKWSFLDRKTGKEASTEVNKAIVEGTTEPGKGNLTNDLNCALEGESCPPNDEKRNDPNGTDHARPQADPDHEKAACSDGKDKACTGGDLSDDSDAGKIKGEIAAADAKEAGGVGKLLASDAFKKIVAGGTAIGLVQIFANLDDALWNNRFGKLVSARRAQEYASLYSTYQTLNDQIKTGDRTSGDEVNAVMNNMANIQKASAFTCLYQQDCTAGQPLEKKVGSGGSADVANSSSNWYKNSLGIVFHPVLSVYKASIGKIVGAIGDFLGGLFSKVLSIIPGYSKIEDWIGEKAGELLSWVIGTAADGTETDAPLMNGLLSGADVTYNGMARDSLGAKAVSNQEAVAIDTAAGRETRAVDRNKSLVARLFDTESPSSAVMQLAANLPSTPSEAVDRSTGYLASFMGRPLDLFSRAFLSLVSSPVYAASGISTKGSWVDLSGVQQYRNTVSDINGPLTLPTKDIAGPFTADGVPGPPDGKIDVYDCPYVQDANVSNPCLLDYRAYETLMASAGMTPTGGLDDAVSATGTTTAPTNPTTGGGAPVTGDARALATQLANDPNMIWTQASTKQGLLTYGSGGSVTNACGNPMGVSPYLTGALLTLSKTWKITVDDIGFGSDRSYCETGTFQHPKGNAIDLQGLEKIGGGKTSPGLDAYDANDQALTSQFASEFVALLPQSSRGGVGQKQCGVKPTWPSWATSVNGAASFEDSCDHLHIDVRNRDNLAEAAGQP